MSLDELVQAALAKALSDYIATMATMDDAFLAKLADMVADRVEARWGKRLEAVRFEVEREMQENYRRRLLELEVQLGRQIPPPTRPWRT